VHAPTVAKIKALNDEYHYLLENGQREKAEHVESLYLFKVRQSVMNPSVSFEVADSKRSLGQAYLKYMDALCLSEMTKATKYLYHFHVGRMFCMRSNYSQAIKHFTFCLRWTNDEMKKLARFYLGYTMSLDPNSLSEADRKRVACYICAGLQEFLIQISKSKIPQGLFATNLYFVFNTVFIQSFINICNIRKSLKPDEIRVIAPDDALN
jgi:hypothetical protein